MEDDSNVNLENKPKGKKEPKFAPQYEVVEGFVRYCPVCGRSWQNAGDTAEEITCGWEDCQAEFKVLKI